jgi:hypothetical protein
MYFFVYSEKCKINAFGMFIMGVYPGAYVDIGEGLNKLSPLSQLRMYPFINKKKKKKRRKGEERVEKIGKAKRRGEGEKRKKKKRGRETVR